MFRLLAGLVAAGALAAPATAHATGYCSPTGDYCYQATVTGGVAKLTFSTFSFKGRVRTCVTPPRGDRTCRRFALRESDAGILTFTKRWSRFFPNAGRGRYRVTYAAPGSSTPLGPGATFRR